MTETDFRNALAAQRTQTPPPAALEALFADWPEEDHPDLCAHCAHMLQHMGAPSEAWQPWLALAAWGWALAGIHWRARAIALALGIEAPLATLWPDISAAPRQPAHLALARLLGCLPVPPITDLPTLDAIVTADATWDILPHVVLSKDWPRTALALATLAEDARESGGASQPWDAEAAPGYEPAHTGACACALRAGFPADLLSAEDRAAFWPAFGGQARWPAASHG